MNVEQMIRDNARRNAAKKQDYDPLSGLNCCGERFVLSVSDKNPRTFYLPLEMKDLPSVHLLQKHGSAAAAVQAQLKLRTAPARELVEHFWFKLCEERYQFDFEFFAVNCITIHDKETAKEIPFILNPAQRMLLIELEKQRKAERQINVQILKARQMGFSTLIQMYMKWIQIIHKENWNSAVCAHDLTAAINIRSMYDFSVREMIPINGIKYTIAPFAGTTNIKEIPERGCRITVGTAVKPETVRSQDLKMVHFSEEAFYPATESNNPELLEASIISAIPKVSHTLIVRESTANGVGDYFYEQWQKAKAGETTYTPIFAPWYMIKLYEELFNGYYYLHNGRRKKGTVSEFISTMTDYEWNLWNNHEECTFENLNWRRMMAATMPNEIKMKQEYPSDDIEAFQDSGSPVFKADDVEALRKDCCLPVAVGDLVSKCAPEIAVVEPKRRKEILEDIRFVVDTEATRHVLEGDAKLRLLKGTNKLHIWEYPDTTQRISNRYIVMFDPQKGVTDSADYGVIKVIDRYWMMYGEEPKVVALFYGHKDKDITIWIATQVAKWYNNALLVVESNTYDSDVKEDDAEFIFDTIAEYYDNLYSRTPADKIVEGAPIKYGFNTNRNTKPMIINHYIALIRERAYIERDEETLNEARVYETKKDGSTGAKQGKHDDRLMATMIGLYVCYQMPIPTEVKAVIREPVRRTAF